MGVPLYRRLDHYAVTAGGSSPKLFVDGTPSWLIPPLYEWIFHWNTHSLRGLGFGELHTQLDALRLVGGLLEDTLVMTRLLTNHCSQSVNGVDLTSWRN